VVKISDFISFDLTKTKRRSISAHIQYYSWFVVCKQRECD